MKRIWVLLILLISVFSLSSCKNGNNVELHNVSGMSEQSAFMNSNSNLAIASEGYYSIAGSTDNMYLTYISKNSAKETYLCSKPECSHVDERTGFYGLETCNAYIGSALPRSIVYYDGFVYVLQYDKVTYDVTLVKISMDGSVHEDILVVGQSADQASYYSYVFVDASTILMVYNAPDYTGEERTVNLEKIDLNKKEKTTVYTYTDKGASIAYLKVLNDNVFFTQVKREDDNYIYQLMLYNIKENKIDAVLDDSIFSYTLGENGQLFYFIPMDGLYQCDLKTMESKKIRACDEETMYSVLAYDEMYLYMDNIDNTIYYNEHSEHKIFVYDLNGNFIRSIPIGVLSVELSDQDYMFTQSFSDKGPYWSYIKKSDISDPSVTWSAVNK